MSVWVLHTNNENVADDSEWAIFGSRKDLFAYVRKWYPEHKQRTREWVNNAKPIQFYSNWWWYEKLDMWSSLG